MKEILAELSKYPIKTRLSLTGTLVVARDIAHAKIKVSFRNKSLCVKFSVCEVVSVFYACPHSVFGKTNYTPRSVLHVLICIVPVLQKLLKLINFIL